MPEDIALVGVVRGTVSCEHKSIEMVKILRNGRLTSTSYDISTRYERHHGYVGKTNWR